MLKTKNNTYFMVALIMLIVGVLIVFSSGKVTTKEEKIQSDSFNEFEYEKELEKRLKNIIEKIDGVGSIEVMITLETSSISSYAKNTNENIESDGAAKKESNIVLSSKSTSVKEPIVSGYKLPEIKGAAVVCEKNLTASHLTKIMGVVSASLGIGTDKIYITN